MIKHIAAATFMLLLASCMSQADTAGVEAAAARFHDMQAAGDDNGIYQAAAPGFRQGARLEDVARLNSAVRNVRGCGAPTRDQSTFNNTMNTSGHFITVVYNRTCTDGPLLETFVFILNGSTAQLYNYNVSGMALFPSAPTAPPSPSASSAAATAPSAPTTPAEPPK